MSADVSIRSYRADDVAGLSALRWASVRAIGSRAYTPEQIEAWLPEPESVEKVRSHFEDGRRAWVAIHDGIVVGAIDLEADGHIDYLYVHPDVAGRGVGSELIARVMSEHAGSLYTKASELARPVFERAGFFVTARRDFDLRGVCIHNYAMTYEPALAERHR